MPRQPLLSPGVSTSLDSIKITPRTPRVFRPSHADDDTEADDFVGSGVDAQEVEMSLLGEDDRRRARPGFADGDGHLHVTHKAPLSLEDKRAMVLLCVLCTSLFLTFSGRSITSWGFVVDLIQGVPVRAASFYLESLDRPSF